VDRRTLLRQSPDPARRRYATETDADLLRVLGVLHPDGRLSRAGELLLAYHRGHSDEAEQKVVELERAAGQINARLVRVSLDLDTPTASRSLADLVRRGVLARTSEATRGPAVTYGPGPAFPSSAPRRRRMIRSGGERMSTRECRRGAP
jgi:hypothetical protein